MLRTAGGHPVTGVDSYSAIEPPTTSSSIIPNNADDLTEVVITLNVTEIPNLDNRSYKLRLRLNEYHQCDLAVLMAQIQTKLRTLPISSGGVGGFQSGSTKGPEFYFEVLHGDYYVDEDYYADLVKSVLVSKNGINDASVSGHGGSSGALRLIGSPHIPNTQPSSYAGTRLAGESISPPSWTFTVRILGQKTVQLTSDALSRLQQNSNSINNPTQLLSNNGGVSNGLVSSTSIYNSQSDLVPISKLNASLKKGLFRIQGRVRKAVRKNSNISEVELSECGINVNSAPPTALSIITLVSFNSATSEKLALVKLGKCYEFKSVDCKGKTSREWQYSSNQHPYKVIVDVCSIYMMIPDPPMTTYEMDTIDPMIGALENQTSCTGAAAVLGIGYPNRVTNGLIHNSALSCQEASVSALSAGLGPYRYDKGKMTPYAASGVASTSGLSGSTNPLSSAAFSSVSFGSNITIHKKTILGPPPGLPSALSQKSISGGSAVLQRHVSKRESSPPRPEPGNRHVTTEKDVMARDEVLLVEEVSKIREEQEAEKILKKRRMEASSVCFICGVDFDSLDGISILIRRLMKWKGAKTEDELKTKFNTPVPSSDEIIELMRERRTQHPVFYRPDRDRIYADASFYNTETKRFHKVHCRCAHLTTDYQNGLPLTEVMMEAELMQTCDFCGELGATVRCCAPGCKFCVHTTCAVFSGGQVDFDQWDPYVMNPACRAHTYHARRKKKIIFDASDAGEMNELQDGVRIIRRYELRDPDDE